MPQAALGTPAPGTGTSGHSPVVEEEGGTPAPAPGLLQVTERRRKYSPRAGAGPPPPPWPPGPRLCPLRATALGLTWPWRRRRSPADQPLCPQSP